MESSGTDYFQKDESYNYLFINTYFNVGVIAYGPSQKNITVNSIKVNRSVSSFPDNNVPSMNYLHTSFATKDDNESKVSKDMRVNSGEESETYEYFVNNEQERLFTCGTTHTYLDRYMNRKLIGTSFVGWDSMEVPMNRDEYAPSLALMMKEHEK